MQSIDHHHNRMEFYLFFFSSVVCRWLCFAGDVICEHFFVLDRIDGDFFFCLFWINNDSKWRWMAIFMWEMTREREKKKETNSSCIYRRTSHHVCSLFKSIGICYFITSCLGIELSRVVQMSFRKKNCMHRPNWFHVCTIVSLYSCVCVFWIAVIVAIELTAP